MAQLAFPIIATGALIGAVISRNRSARNSEYHMYQTGEDTDLLRNDQGNVSYITECKMATYIAQNAETLYRLIMEDTKNNKIPMRVLALTRCFNTVFVILALLLGYKKTNEIIHHCLSLIHI